VLLVAPHDALQAATKTIPSRYRGIGQNPNTVAMLFAAAIPLATWLALVPRRRLLGLAALLLLGGSIAGSGSRGALVAGLGGALVVLLAATRGRRDRVLAAAAALAAFGIAVGVTQIPQPDPNATLAAGIACENCTHRPNDADAIERLDDELGRPRGADPGEERTFFASTGRTQAWRGAIDQGRERPLLGYGFGTEDGVFVDRYYSFFGGSPENSYIGMFLQLGFVGVALLVALALALGRGAVVALRRLRGRGRAAAGACAAVVAAGLGLALVQSYVYAVGNDATLTVWLCAFLGLALVPRPLAARP
jgi:O-antigen ligase